MMNERLRIIYQYLILLSLNTQFMFENSQIIGHVREHFHLSEAQVWRKSWNRSRQHVFLELLALADFAFELIEGLSVEVWLVLVHAVGFPLHPVQGVVVVGGPSSKRINLVVLALDEVAALALRAVEVLDDFQAELLRQLVPDQITLLEDLVDDVLLLKSHHFFVSSGHHLSVRCRCELKQLLGEALGIVFEAAINAVFGELPGADLVLVAELQLGVPSLRRQTLDQCVDALLGQVVRLPGCLKNGLESLGLERLHRLLVGPHHRVEVVLELRREAHLDDSEAVAVSASLHLRSRVALPQLRDVLV